MTHSTQIPPHAAATGAPDAGMLLVRGAVAGLSAGMAFIIATMFYAGSQGKPATGPFLAIATIFHGSDTPVPTPANMVIGLVMHLALSLAFGIGFALLTPALRFAPLLIIAALAYGAALYVLNVQILGRTAFPFFTSTRGPNQVFELLIHLLYGLFLAPFFLGRRSHRTRSAAAAP